MALHSVALNCCFVSDAGAGHGAAPADGSKPNSFFNVICFLLGSYLHQVSDTRIIALLSYLW